MLARTLIALGCLSTLVSCGYGEARLEVGSAPGASSPVEEDQPGGVPSVTPPPTPVAGDAGVVVLDPDSGVPVVPLPDGGFAPIPGIPCDVSTVLAQRCSNCHGVPLQNFAPVRLLTHQDLLAPSASIPGQTMGDRVVVRINSTVSPMPPAPATLTAAERATLESWVASGMPAGEACSGADGGAVIPPVEQDAGTPPPIVSVCTSNTFWTGGNNGSASMNPGRACIACHSQGDGPTFAAAGTVYPTVREPNLCNGRSGVTVEITDANNVVRTATTNGAGNFNLTGVLAKPYRVRLLYQGRVRVMNTPQTSGDCNSCHTETGLNGAPGRIVAP